MRKNQGVSTIMDKRMTYALAFYCRESDKDKKGLAPILVSISINCERQWLQTKFKANPAEFKKAMTSPKDHPLKKYVQTLRQTLDDIYADLMAEGIPQTAENLKKYYLKGGVRKTLTFDEISQEYLALQAQRVDSKNNPITMDTYNRYQKTVKMFKEANALTGTEPARSISSEHIIRYQNWLGQKYDNATSCNYLQKLKALFKYAFESGKISTQPFVGIRIKKGEKDVIKYLTQEELSVLKSKPMPCERLEEVRDVFVFGCYTGLGFADIKALQPEDFRTADTNQVYIKKRRQKTGIFFTVPLLPPALEIAQKYDFKLPVKSNQKTNAYLKEVQTLCGLEKELTYYMSRHTAAVYLLNSHVPIETVGKILGHKEGSKETKTYAKMLDSTVFDDMLNLEMDEFGEVSPDVEAWNKLLSSLTVVDKKKGD